MVEFDFYNPVHFIFGRGKLAKIGSLTRQYGKKVLIVTSGSTARTGVLAKVIGYAKEAGLEYAVFDKVTANPLTTTVYAGAKVACDEHCDVVIGIGGGSAMDAAKAIAFMARNSGDITAYMDGAPGAGALPIILVATTAGTGSEGNMGAVVTDQATNDKRPLKTQYIYPKASIIDPELFRTLSKRQIAGPGLDALYHSIESYIGNRCNPVTEMIALQAITLLARHLPAVYDDADDIAAWEKVALASTLSGVVIGFSGTCLPHGLEHPVSGLFNVAHGEGLAAVFLQVMEFAHRNAPERFAAIARAMGVNTGGMSPEEAAAASIEAVAKLMERMNMTPKLRDLGVTKEDLDWLTANALKTGKANIENTPRVPDAKEIRELYLQCL
ncbi:MAG: iron-containing alcohol dehydrogenase [Negativicutes bacterium]|nr:iron-containing alcohol dehydrogenase [Negativicutes bacterium]